MYIPNTSWTHELTRSMDNPGLRYYVERCACGFGTTERLPGSNASMNAARAEQERHEIDGCY